MDDQKYCSGKTWPEDGIETRTQWPLRV